MKNRPELITDEELKVLKEVAGLDAKNERMQRWREDFTTDPIMARIPMETVLRHLRMGIENEEKVRATKARAREAEGSRGAKAAEQLKLNEAQRNAPRKNGVARTDEGAVNKTQGGNWER